MTVSTSENIVKGTNPRTDKETLTLIGEKGTELTLENKLFFRESYPLTHREGEDRVGLTDEYTREQLISLRDFINQIIEEG